MAKAVKRSRIDELVEQAETALQREACFEAERMAAKAMRMARDVNDFTRLARTCQPLKAAREQRAGKAMKTGRVDIFDAEISEDMTVEPGCYLVQPPQVGADARRLRLAALSREVPALVICREPLTQTGQWPVVAITSGVTVRTKIDPPENPDVPNLDWFSDALDALGQWAIMSIDCEMEPDRRIDALLARLDATPDSLVLHDVLAETCLDYAAQSDESVGQKQK